MFQEHTIPFIFANDKIFLEGIFQDSVCYFILDNGFTSTCLSKPLFSRYYDTTTLKIQNPDWTDPTYVVPIHIKLKDYDFVIDTVVAFDLSIYDTKREIISDKGGFIGVELFQRHIVELNFEDSVMSIKDKLPKNIEEYAHFDLLNIKNCSSKYDSLFKQIEISGFYDLVGNPFVGRFLVDLGCPFTILSNTFQRNVDENLSKKDTIALAVAVLSYGPFMTPVSGNNAKEAKKKIIEDGKIIDVEDYTEQKFGDGILGISFLSKFHLIFDYPHNKLYLKRNNLRQE